MAQYKTIANRPAMAIEEMPIKVPISNFPKENPFPFLTLTFYLEKLYPFFSLFQ